MKHSYQFSLKRQPYNICGRNRIDRMSSSSGSMLKNLKNVEVCAYNVRHAKILTTVLLGKVSDFGIFINCCLAKFKIIKTLLDRCINLWNKAQKIKYLICHNITVLDMSFPLVSKYYPLTPELKFPLHFSCFIFQCFGWINQEEANFYRAIKIYHHYFYIITQPCLYT